MRRCSCSIHWRACGALQQVVERFRRGYASNSHPPVYGSAVSARRVGAQVEVAAGQQQRVREDDFADRTPSTVSTAVGRCWPLLPDVADAVDLAQRAAEERVDAGVADAVVGDVQPHVVGGVAQPARQRDAVHVVGGQRRGGPWQRYSSQ